MEVVHDLKEKSSTAAARGHVKEMSEQTCGVTTLHE